MATPLGTLAWRIPWTKNPSGLQSMGSQRVGHNFTTKQRQKRVLQWEDSKDCVSASPDTNPCGLCLSHLSAGKKKYLGTYSVVSGSMASGMMRKVSDAVCDN